MPQTTPISPLRQRLIDDMTIRRLAPKTQVAYINGVKLFAEFIHCTPDKATTEDLPERVNDFETAGLVI